MDLQEWKEEYTMGMEIMDEHHKKFLDIINMLIKIKNERSCNEEISLVFFRLIYYIENYFVDEEVYIKKNKYPDRKLHKLAHNNFIREVISLQEQYQKGDTNICSKLYDSLTNWFNNHILVEDRKAVEFLKEVGVA